MKNSNPTAGEAAGRATRSDFETASAAFHEALGADDADALFGYVADGVLLMPPGEAPVRGKNAMKQWYAGFLSRYRTSTFTRSDREVIAADGLIVELGGFEWVLTPVGDGDPVEDRGNYMQVWRPQSDGRWRFEREIWNSTTPAP